MTTETESRQPGASWLIDGFRLGLAQVLGEVTQDTAQVDWHPRTGIEALAEMAGGESAETRWWEQPLSHPRGAVVWVGVSNETLGAVGKRMRTSVGLACDGAEEETEGYTQVLHQALHSLALTLSAKLGTAVHLNQGRFLTDTPEPDEVFSLRTDCLNGSLLFGINAELLETVRQIPAPVADTRASGPTAGFPSLGVLSGVNVSVSVLIGRTQLSLRDTMNLTSGSIIELDAAVGDRVHVVVGNAVIASGEVVVIDGNYGVRIQQVAGDGDLRNQEAVA